MSLIGSGVLGHKKSNHFPVELQRDVTYKIHVTPSSPGVDFDLYVHDEHGNVVAKDDRPSADAWGYVTPVWTGPFVVSVFSYSGTSTYTVSVEDA